MQHGCARLITVKPDDVMDRLAEIRLAHFTQKLKEDRTIIIVVLLRVEWIRHWPDDERIVPFHRRDDLRAAGQILCNTILDRKRHQSSVYERGKSKRAAIPGNFRVIIRIRI